jgi:hypothetical protein
VFEAVAGSTIRLARFVPEDELSMEPLVADALLQFADDLREASAAAVKWARTKGIAQVAEPRVSAETS